MNCFTSRANAQTIPITLLEAKAFKAWKSKQSQRNGRWIDSRGYRGKSGELIALAGKDGAVARIVAIVTELADPWAIAAVHDRLPKGKYAIDEPLDASTAELVALGWGLASYEFGAYKKLEKRTRSLVWPQGCDRKRVTRLVEALGLCRDLINTPAGDQGPAELAATGTRLAERHGGKCTVISGDELLAANYPAIHAVGRASSREPCLVDLSWGQPDHPKVTLVGKGVVFDTGGLDIKNAPGMRLMKKDMGGAGAVFGLAHALMSRRLPIRLRVLVPAVENAVAGNAYRPGDVLQTRKGTTVEVGNTDAEGRLILCDALTEAASESPELLMDFATLTGAARIALGTELPALFSSDDDIAHELLQSGERTRDPLWRMPLFQPYRRHLDSRIADLCNIAHIPQGGAITAALFLQHFVPKSINWTHVDTMGWNSQGRPGRPQGGEGFAIRAFYDMLERKYGG